MITKLCQNFLVSHACLCVNALLQFFESVHVFMKNNCVETIPQKITTNHIFMCRKIKLTSSSANNKTGLIESS
jgi:hypothetical protein